MRNSSRSRTSAACWSLVSRTISRLTRVWRTSTSGMALALRTARIISMVNSSGTSIISRRTRSPFFNSVEYSTSYNISPNSTMMAPCNHDDTVFLFLGEDWVWPTCRTSVRIRPAFSRISAVCAILWICSTACILKAQTGTINDVQHVVIFIQENRSFDEYFGSLKGVHGFSDRNSLTFQNGNTDLFQPQGGNYVLPF